MKAETLAELNAERAARRPALVVTDMAGGEQRLVKAKDIATDRLAAELDKHLRMGKSGMIEVDGKKLFITVHAPTAKLVITGAVHISQALAPMARALDYDVTVVDPRTAFASPERFPDIPLIAEWPDVALPPLNVDPLHGVRRADARSEDRRSGADACAGKELLLYRRARLAQNPCEARRAAEAAGRFRSSARAHSRADRPCHRRGLARRDRRCDHGGDHRASCACRTVPMAAAVKEPA